MTPYRMMIAVFCLAGCSVPIFEPNARQAVSARFASPVPQAGRELDMNWWASFRDPQLAELLRLARQSSPDLRSAAASVLAARATARQSDAGLYPTLDGSASITRSGGENTSRQTTEQGGLDASWELDLFAKAASQSKADRDRASAEEISYVGSYVSLSSEVADYYVQYRACRETESIYRAALASQSETLEATRGLVEFGLGSESDQSLAIANSANAKISLTGQQADCRILAQTLAVTVGSPQHVVDSILGKGGGLPTPAEFRVGSVPSDLIRQRPDIVAAELNFGAALGDTRVAQADLFPSLSLSGSITATNPQSWQFGPALSLPIFDGGARRAAVRSSNAASLAAAETYRATVLAAVAEVEGALTKLNAAGQKAASTRTAVNEYDKYFKAADENWSAGATSLLDREEARRQLQDAQMTEISVREDRLRQWIALYKAMGGGWRATRRPAAPAPTEES